MWSTIYEQQVHEHVSRRLLVHPDRKGINDSAEEGLNFGLYGLEQPGTCQREDPLHLHPHSAGHCLVWLHANTAVSHAADWIRHLV